MESRDFLKKLLGLAGAATVTGAMALPALAKPEALPAAARPVLNPAGDIAEVGLEEPGAAPQQEAQYYYRRRRYFVRRRYYRPRYRVYRRRYY